MGYLMIALSAKLFSAFSCYPAPNPLRIRSSAKHARKPCGIRTSKTKDLKSFRIRISGKTPGGPPRMPNQSSSTGTPACVPSASPSRQPSPTSRSASDGFRSFTPRRCRASARPAMLAAPRSGDLQVAISAPPGTPPPDMLSSVGTGFRAPAKPVIRSEARNLPSPAAGKTATRRHPSKEQRIKWQSVPYSLD